MTELAVKVSFRGEMRRFRYAGGDSFCSLTDELKKVLLLPAESEFSVLYRDDEGDSITMGSNAELAEALQMATNGILHLTVVLATEPQAASLPTPITATLINTPTTPSPFVPSPLPKLHQNYGMQYPIYMKHPSSPALSVPTPVPVQVVTPPTHFLQRPTPIPVQTPLPPQIPLSASATFTPSSASVPSSTNRGFASQCHQQRVKMQEWREEREKAIKHWKAQEKQAKKQEKRQAKAASKQPLILVARFVKDVTVQDGMFFSPNTSFVKTWRLRNESAIPWPEGAVELVFDGKNSDQMGGPEAVVVPTSVPAGAEVDITLNLVSPSKPGRYVGFWRLRTRDGKKFGQRLWVQIHVISPEEEARYNEDLYRWRPALEKLQALGYYDTKQNIKLLNKYGGNIPKVVKRITKKMKKLNIAATTPAQQQQQAHLATQSSPALSPAAIHPLNLPPTI